MNNLKFLYQELIKKYTLITENTQEYIWVLDLSSLNFVFISPSTLAFRGVELEDAMKESIAEIFTKESYKRFKTLVLKKAQKFLIEGDNGKNSTSTHEFEIYNFNGEIMHIELFTKFNILLNKFVLL